MANVTVNDDRTAETKVAISNARLMVVIVGICMLIAAPIIILYIILSLFVGAPHSGWNIPVYVYPIVLAYAALSPLVMPTVERVSAQNVARRSAPNKSLFSQLYAISVIRLAAACAPYCFALFVFIASRSLTWALAFYPVGIFWSFRLWPTKRVLESYLQRIESNVPYAG